MTLLKTCSSSFVRLGSGGSRASLGGPAGHTWGRAPWGRLPRRPVSPPAFLSHLLALALPGLISQQHLPPPPLQEKQRRGVQVPGASFYPAPSTPCTAVSLPQDSQAPRGPRRKWIAFLRACVRLSASHSLPRGPTPASSPDPLLRVPLPRRLGGHGASQGWAQPLSLSFPPSRRTIPPSRRTFKRQVRRQEVRGTWD